MISSHTAELVMLSAALFILGFVNCVFGQVVAAYDYNTEEINTNYVKKFDCPTTTHAHLSQNELQASMDRFAYLFYLKKDVEAAFTQCVASNYVQHNPNILDGRDEAIKPLTPLFSAKGNTYVVGTTFLTIHAKILLIFHTDWKSNGGAGVHNNSHQGIDGGTATLQCF